MYRRDSRNWYLRSWMCVILAHFFTRTSRGKILHSKISVPIPVSGECIWCWQTADIDSNERVDQLINQLRFLFCCAGPPDRGSASYCKHLRRYWFPWDWPFTTSGNWVWLRACSYHCCWSPRTCRPRSSWARTPWRNRAWRSRPRWPSKPSPTSAPWPVCAKRKNSTQCTWRRCSSPTARPSGSRGSADSCSASLAASPCSRTRRACTTEATWSPTKAYPSIASSKSASASSSARKWWAILFALWYTFPVMMQLILEHTVTHLIVLLMRMVAVLLFNPI